MGCSRRLTRPYSDHSRNLPRCVSSVAALNGVRRWRRRSPGSNGSPPLVADSTPRRHSLHCVARQFRFQPITWGDTQFVMKNGQMIPVRNS